MPYISGVDRHQPQLLPPCLEDYVGPEHPVRAIDAFVQCLDLVRLGFDKAPPAETGRPAYHPAVLLSLYLWGYLNRVQSSRRLEIETHRNLEVIWLLGQLKPDFKTISDFRRDNRAALKEVFRQFVLLCRELDLFGGQLLAIDGTKFKASNNPAKQLDEKALRQALSSMEASIEEYLAAAENTDRDLLGTETSEIKDKDLKRKLEALRRKKQHYEQALEIAVASGGKAPLIDPESRSMKKVGLGYNGQFAIDSKHHLLAVAEATNQANDYGQLAMVAEEIREVLDITRPKLTADAGYRDRSDLVEAQEAGGEVYVPHPRTGLAVTTKNFHKDDFVYEAEEDAYRCPAGQLLPRNGCFEKYGDILYGYTNPGACKKCPLKKQCTTGPYRRIERWEKEFLIEAMDEEASRHPEIMAQRKTLIEHPFGTIKFWRAQGALLTRGRNGAQAELSLSALAYNLTRVLNLLGVKKLIAAIRARRGGTGAGLGGLLSALVAWKSYRTLRGALWMRFWRQLLKFVTPSFRCTLFSAGLPHLSGAEGFHTVSGVG